ncbi:MAG: helix-turn-helix domain-containing protein [Pseudomonadota bacterium]
MPEVTIVLTDNFPILSLTLITEPMRVANRELANRVWNWRLLSTNGGPVESSSGFELVTEPLDNQAQDIIILLSSYRPEAALVKPMLSWLRKAARTGTMMGCVDTGAMIFAEAGLLSKTPAAVHFEALTGYREKYRNQLFVDRMYSVSRNRCSSAGGVSTFDMTLGLIEQYNGKNLSLRVAEILTYRPTEFDGPQQKLLAETSLMRLDRNLGRAVDLMLAHMQYPLSVEAIVQKINTPHWTLARLFKRHLDMTPSQYYRHLRLTQAKNLLVNSGYRINEIANLCGFENPESFARSYKQQFGISASQDRKQSAMQG